MNRLTTLAFKQSRGREINFITTLGERGMFNHYGGKDENECRPRLEQEAAHTGVNEAVGLTELAPNQPLPGTCFTVASLKDLSNRIYGPFTPRDFVDTFNTHPSSITLTNQDVMRWKMASRAVQIYATDSPVKEYQRLFNQIMMSKETLYPRVVVPRCGNWPGMEDEMDLQVALGFSTAALIYGGLHALAWFAHFDSSTEQTLWRISACVVMAGVPIGYLILIWGMYMSEQLDESELVILPPFIFLVLLIMLAYVLARAYLVVECFINLSHLPAGVYDVPTWSAYFPHIS